jgi:hypothetical protein
MLKCTSSDVFLTIFIPHSAALLMRVISSEDYP